MVRGIGIRESSVVEWRRFVVERKKDDQRIRYHRKKDRISSSSAEHTLNMTKITTLLEFTQNPPGPVLQIHRNSPMDPSHP